MNNNNDESKGKHQFPEHGSSFRVRVGLPHSDLPLELRHVPPSKLQMYLKQIKAPRPVAVKCYPRNVNTPPMYNNDEFFGKISHTEAEKKLTCSGAYLIRQSGAQTDYYALSLRFMNRMLHYKLYYDAGAGKHYVRDKRFDKVYDLVNDGLQVLYMDICASSFSERMPSPKIYEKIPYIIIHKKKLESLAKETGINRPSSYNSIDSRRAAGCKTHNFKIVHTFKGLNWCDYCANFMWGLVQEGVKCDDCGYIAHRKCSERKGEERCLPAITDMKVCFGNDLTMMAKSQGENIPWIVKKCIEEIKKRGIESEGLYRVSGFAEEIDALKNTIDKCGIETDMSRKVYDNINVITGVLKLYFRQLPVPLINLATLDSLLRCVAIEDEMILINSISSSLTILPEPHYYTLKYLVDHLHHVAELSAVNKMSVTNIATVFCPSLMPLPMIHQGCGLPDMSKEIDVLGLIIKYNERIFIH